MDLTFDSIVSYVEFDSDYLRRAESEQFYGTLSILFSFFIVPLLISIHFWNDVFEFTIKDRDVIPLMMGRYSTKLRNPQEHDSLFRAYYDSNSDPKQAAKDHQQHVILRVYNRISENVIFGFSLILFISSSGTIFLSSIGVTQSVIASIGITIIYVTIFAYALPVMLLLTTTGGVFSNSINSYIELLTHPAYICAGVIWPLVVVGVQLSYLVLVSVMYYILFNIGGIGVMIGLILLLFVTLLNSAVTFAVLTLYTRSTAKLLRIVIEETSFDI